ncbi:competence protein ComJ [Burkholderia cenocepacia]|uniref:competence protein ComJ n=1 Tax=Burkholderia cenocepacia TaxID=95486 RepID=UPI002AB25142|nr:competence protein ComJ [Burkholderia cenocepacia]
MQTIDLLISHSQIVVRSRPYDEGLSRWGTGNIDQGAVLRANYLIFDPLPDDAFGAKVYLQVSATPRDAAALRDVAQRAGQGRAAVSGSHPKPHITKRYRKTTATSPLRR